MMQQSCPHCHTAQEVNQVRQGARVKCAYCRGSFRVNMAREAVEPVFGNLALAPRKTRSGDLKEAPFAAEEKNPQLEEVRKARRPNFMVEGYDIKECRGRGGMGQVYRAVQKSLGREVAIKTLDQSLARNQASILRFTKEAAAMARMRHPNIVHVIDRGRVGQRHYFVMEFVDGPSLRDLLQDGAFMAPEALRIMLQLSRTMEYAHSEGVVHRDLKPENILYTNTGVLKVADFGLAGVNQETTYIRKLTKSFVSMGTECYMAPEQRRDAKNVDHRADLYSLGVIFYELMTNQLPLLHVPREDPSIAPDHPKIEKIILKCLEVSPDKRYQTTAALGEAIEEAIKDLEKVHQPIARDTVVDTPAIDGDRISFGSRLSVWPNRLHSSISDLASHWTSSWRTAAMKKMFWSGGATVLLGLGVALFFLFSPKPPTPKSLQGKEAGPSWHKQPAQENKLKDQRTQLSFDFTQRQLHTSWGRHPRHQWSLKGNWVATPGELIQNTYQNFFLRNHRNCWALYTGHFLSPKDLSVSTTAQLLEPRIPYRGQVLQLSEYTQRILPKNQRFKRYPTIGVGVQGLSGGEISFMLRPHKDRLAYVFRVRGLKRDGRKPAFRLYPGVLRARLRYGTSMNIQLMVKDHVASAWVDGKRIEEIKLQPAEIFPSQAGLICRDAHCKFRNIAFKSYVFRRHSS